MICRKRYALLFCCVYAQTSMAADSPANTVDETKAMIATRVHVMRKKHEEMIAKIQKTAPEKQDDHGASSWASPYAWANWLGISGGMTRLYKSPAAQDVGDRLFHLCIDYKKENLPLIEQLLSDKSFKINDELQSRDIGGVTLLHAVVWMWRDYAKSDTRPVFLDTVKLMLKYQADPHVEINTRGPGTCIINDTPTFSVHSDVINSAYKHVLLAGDKELSVLFSPYKMQEDKQVVARTYWDANCRNPVWLTYAAEASSIGSADVDKSVSMDSVFAPSYNDGDVKDVLFKLCTAYDEANYFKIEQLLKSFKENINSEFTCSSWPRRGFTLSHALICDWRNNYHDADKYQVFWDIQELLLDYGSKPEVEIPACIVEDKPTWSVHHDVINSAYKHVLFAGDKDLIHLFDAKVDGNKCTTVKFIWSAHSDLIRWRTHALDNQ